MNLLSLVFVNLGRNKARTILTMMSVIIALFLFCTLRGVLDTLHSAIEVGSESRLVTRNAISLVFALPQSYRARIAQVDGVGDVAVQNWFGARYPANDRLFFAQFAVDAEHFFPIYAHDLVITQASPAQVNVAIPPGVDPKLAAYLAEQNACIVGEGLLKKLGLHVGSTLTLAGTIYPGEWPFVIRAVYHATSKGFGDETMFFHYNYLEQKGMGGNGQVGVYILKLTDPSRASAIAKTIDTAFENSAAATRTETERAFQAGFVSMYGNIPFLLRVIGLAIAFAILLVAANTMMMAVRERTSEFGVMKTLGFDDGTIFKVILAEAAIITLGGGIIGSLLAKFVLEGSGFNAGGFLPPMTVRWSSVGMGLGIALLMGAASGILPAREAARLRIVDAIRRVG